MAWPLVDPSQALSWAVRLCAVAQLVGLLELALVRAELLPSGFLDWTMIGNLSPKARTRGGTMARAAFRRLPDRALPGIVLAQALLATALLAWPSSWVLIAAVAAFALLLIKRHHVTIDGSDQMALVVLVACLVGRLGADHVSLRVAVSFLAAELTLSYLVAGVAKGISSYWRSGTALTVIVHTRMYGHPFVARVLRRHPMFGRMGCYAVLGWESLFFVCLTAPPWVVVGMLVIGVGFHAGCGVVMGLNRFMWAFAASYPAVLCTNDAIRSQLGSSTADLMTVALAGLGIAGLIFAGSMSPIAMRDTGRTSAYRPGRTS